MCETTSSVVVLSEFTSVIYDSIRIFYGSVKIYSSLFVMLPTCSDECYVSLYFFLYADNIDLLYKRHICHFSQAAKSVVLSVSVIVHLQCRNNPIVLSVVY